MSTHPNSPAREGAHIWAQEATKDKDGGDRPPDKGPKDEGKDRPGGGGGGDAGGGGHDHGAPGGGAQCAHVPEFKRLNYFYGQMLGAADFRAEQDYFREKMKLHNRCLHGYGVVCGLRVVPVPEEEPCAPEGDARVQRLTEELKQREEELKKARAAGDEAKAKELAARVEEIRRELEKIRTEECAEVTPTRVVVECGLALDCDGNELVVRRPLVVDLWRELSRADRDRVRDDRDRPEQGGGEKGKDATGGGGGAGDYRQGPDGIKNPPGGVPPDDGGRGGSTLYVSICYCEQPTDPVRPVVSDACGLPAECSYGKTRDSVRVRVTYDAPEADERCATCCEACGDKCLLLARVDNFRAGQPLDERDVHNEVRRPVSLYVPTVITGISWTDGAEYTEDEAESLLGVSPAGEANPPKGFMLVRFSRPVHVSTIARGVVDIWVSEGGGTKHAGIYNHDVEYVDLPASGMTDRLRFRAVSDESPNPGDRVMIMVRGSRLLDHCCRPVDAANTGGRTPFVPDEEFDDFRRETPAAVCGYPPPFGYGPWTSGTNAAGSDFVSWFYIKPNAARARH